MRNTALIYFASITTLGLVQIVIGLKLVKLFTYLFNPRWEFNQNLTIEPLIKTKSTYLSWSLTILLMPIVVLLASLRMSSTVLGTLGSLPSAIIIIAFIYIISILILIAALIERLLPRKVYENKQQLTLDTSIYTAIFTVLFVYTLSIGF